MSQLVAVTRTRSTWSVTGDPHGAAGVATLTGPGFVLRVDAADRRRLVDLVVDLGDDEGRAVLDAWLDAPTVGALADGALVTCEIGPPGAAGRLLGDVADAMRLRDVDGGPRGAMWSAEILGRWCSLAAVDERFSGRVRPEAIEAALDDVQRTVAAARASGWVLSDDTAELVGSLVAELSAALRPSWDAVDEWLTAALSAAAGALGHEAAPPPAGDRVERPGVPIAVDRRHLPAGLELSLESSASLTRVGLQAVLRLDGVERWPAQQLYVIGRAPASGQLRTLDELTFDGRSTATATMDLHESDFVEGAELRCSIATAADAVGELPEPVDAVFGIVASELALLQLLAAEVVATFAGHRLPALERRAEESRGHVVGLTAAHVDADQVALAVRRATAAGADGLVTPSIARWAVVEGAPGGGVRSQAQP